MPPRQGVTVPLYVVGHSLAVANRLAYCYVTSACGVGHDGRNGIRARGTVDRHQDSLRHRYRLQVRSPPAVVAFT
jgi:hypothetical protein